MAIISTFNTIVDLPKLSYTVFYACLTWLFIRIIPLSGFRNKIRLAIEWFRLCITNNPSIRNDFAVKKNSSESQ